MITVIIIKCQHHRRVISCTLPCCYSSDDKNQLAKISLSHMELTRTNCVSFQICLNLIFLSSDSPAANEHGSLMTRRQKASNECKKEDSCSTEFVENRHGQKENSRSQPQVSVSNKVVCLNSTGGMNTRSVSSF